MIEKKYLQLAKRRKLMYYLNTILIAIISMFMAFLVIKGFINQEGYYHSPYFAIFLAFPAMTFLLFLHQKSRLQMTSIETKLSAQDNYKIAKATLKELNWKVKRDKKTLIEAYTDETRLLTWNDEMFSIVITNEQVFINSICNVDTNVPTDISWGQNTKNVKQFKLKFEKIANAQFAINV